MAREEQDVAEHRERRGGGDEDGPAVEAPAREGQADEEHGAERVRRHGEELFLDRGFCGVDGADDGGREEGEALHGDVVEEEDEGRREHHRVPEAEPELVLVGFVEDARLRHALGLNARDGEVFLLLCEPARGFGPVREREEGDEG